MWEVKRVYERHGDLKAGHCPAFYCCELCPGGGGFGGAAGAEPGVTRSQTRDALNPLERPPLKLTTSIRRWPSSERLKRCSNGGRSSSGSLGFTTNVPSSQPQLSGGTFPRPRAGASRLPADSSEAFELG